MEADGTVDQAQYQMALVMMTVEEAEVQALFGLHLQPQTFQVGIALQQHII